MLPQLPAYTPSEFLPDSFGRYRQYPRSVRAPVPGVGYDVGRMVWAEQELNLSGGRSQSYGNYAAVPLRGLGQNLTVAPLLSVRDLPRPSPETSIPLIPGPAEDASDAVEDAVEQLLPEEEGFLTQKVGPVPVWALGLVGVAAVGGGAWWFLRRKR